MRINLYSDGSYSIEEAEYKFPWERTPTRGRKGDGSEKDFRWETDRGQFVYPRDMATPHLINALNMLWRNFLEIKEDRPEIRNEWSYNYVQRAIKELSAEIQARVEAH